MTEPVPEIDVRTAERRARSGEVLLLDVREDDEWAAGRAELALHRPLSRLQLGDVPTDRPVVAVCRVGGRSAQATQALRSAGLDVTNMGGGMLAWQAAGLPLVGDDGPGVVS